MLRKGDSLHLTMENFLHVLVHECIRCLLATVFSGFESKVYIIQPYKELSYNLKSRMYKHLELRQRRKIDLEHDHNRCGHISDASTPDSPNLAFQHIGDDVHQH